MEVQLGSRVLSWTVFCFIWLPGPTSCACGRQAALHSVFLHLSCINYLKYFDSKERPGIPMRPLAAPAKARRTQTAMGTRHPSAPSGCSREGSPNTNSDGNLASKCALWLLLPRPVDHYLWSPSSPSSS